MPGRCPDVDKETRAAAIEVRFTLRALVRTACAAEVDDPVRRTKPPNPPAACGSTSRPLPHTMKYPSSRPHVVEGFTAYEQTRFPSTYSTGLGSRLASGASGSAVHRDGAQGCPRPAVHPQGQKRQKRRPEMSRRDSAVVRRPPHFVRDTCGRQRCVKGAGQQECITVQQEDITPAARCHCPVFGTQNPKLLPASINCTHASRRRCSTLPSVNVCD